MLLSKKEISTLFQLSLISLALFFFFIVIPQQHPPALVSGLECYTGYSIVGGDIVGTDKQSCTKDSDRCYNMSVRVATLTNFKMAGCSTYRCMAAGEECTNQNVAGQEFSICCCNTDLCNLRKKSGGIMDKIKDGLLKAVIGGR